eukprot:m.107578 g.107578  ORF g.107578 m.107578 type:complete len:752 (-) comp15856_c1_seq2:369-2624(-)
MASPGMPEITVSSPTVQAPSSTGVFAAAAAAQDQKANIDRARPRSRKAGRSKTAKKTKRGEGTPTRRPMQRSNSCNKFAEELMKHRMEINEEILKETRIKDGCEKFLRVMPKQKRRRKDGPNDVEIMLAFCNAKLAALHNQLTKLNKSVLHTAQKSTVYRTLKKTGWRQRSIYRKLNQDATEDKCLPFIVLGAKASDPLPLKEALRECLSTHYMENPKFMDEVLDKMQDYRDKLNLASPTKTGFRNCVLYYQFLVYAEPRFFRDSQLNPLIFRWYDSLTGSLSMSRTVALEKAATVFNAASIASQLAATQDHSSETGLEMSVTFFELAAGAFEFVRTHLDESPSLDLSGECLELLQTLMLAQAQECIWRLYIGNESQRQSEGWVPQPGEAAAVAEQFHVVSEMLKWDSLKGELPSDWVHVVEAKRAAFYSIADVQQALHVNSSPDAEKLRPTVCKYLSRAQETFLRTWRDCSQRLPEMPLLGNMIYAESAITTSVIRQLRLDQGEQDPQGPMPAYVTGEAVRWSCAHCSQLSELCPDPFEPLGPLYFFNSLCSLAERKVIDLWDYDEAQIKFKGESPPCVEEVSLGSAAYSAGLRAGQYVLAVGREGARYKDAAWVAKSLKSADQTASIPIEVVSNLDMQNFEELSDPSDVPASPQHSSRSDQENLGPQVPVFKTTSKFSSVLTGRLPTVSEQPQEKKRISQKKNATAAHQASLAKLPGHASTTVNPLMLGATAKRGSLILQELEEVDENV